MKFEQNFQKPMADRSSLQQDFLKNNHMKIAAGVGNSQTASLKHSINDGKERLFGTSVDEQLSQQPYGR